MREEVRSGADSFIENHVSQQNAVGPDDRPRADDYVRPKMDALAELGSRVDDGGGMDAGRVLRTGIEEFKRARKRMVRICKSQRGKRNRRKLRVDQDRSSAGRLGEWCIFWVGDKGELVRAGLFYPSYARYIRLREYSVNLNICFSAYRRGSDLVCGRPCPEWSAQFGAERTSQFL
jgi:hypothetical protein